MKGKSVDDIFLNSSKTKEAILEVSLRKNSVTVADLAIANDNGRLDEAIAEDEKAIAPDPEWWYAQTYMHSSAPLLFARKANAALIAARPKIGLKPQRKPVYKESVQFHPDFDALPIPTKQVKLPPT